MTFMDTGNPNFFNRYAYSFNDPINLFDPNGMAPESVMDRRYVYSRLPSEQQAGLDAVHLEVSENISKAIGVSATIIPIGKGVQVAGTTAKGALAGRALSTSSKKAIRSLKQFIKEHKAKLKAYKKDPDKFDNKGFLKNAKNDEQRNSIINGRIRHLKKEIKDAKLNIKKIQRTNDTPRTGTRIRGRD